MGVAVDAAGEVAVGIRVLAVRGEPARAVEAGPAGDVERHDDPVALPERPHAAARLLHHAGELVAEGAAHPSVGDQAVQQVQVGAADGGAGDPQDDVVGVLDLGVLLADHLDLVGCLIAERAHGTPGWLQRKLRSVRPHRTERALRRRRGGRAGGRLAGAPVAVPN